MTAFFLVIDGMDGAGKTTAARLLAESLARDFRSTVLGRTTRSVDDPQVTERLHVLADLLWNYPANTDVRRFGREHLISLMASWFHLFGRLVVVPALQQFEVVVVEPWYFRYIARFAAEGIDCSGFFEGMVKPDLVCLFKIEPEEALRRKGGRIRATERGGATSDCVDDSAQFVRFQNDVAAQMHRVASKVATVEVIDASRSEHVIASEIARIVKGRERTSR